MTVDQFIETLGRVIVNPLIRLLLAAAIIYFLWGVFVYIKSGDDPTERAKGRLHMIWGAVGLVIMVSVFAIMEIATNTVFGP